MKSQILYFQPRISGNYSYVTYAMGQKQAYYSLQTIRKTTIVPRTITDGKLFCKDILIASIDS